jgi:Fe-S cluster assembly protein SufD
VPALSTPSGTLGSGLRRDEHLDFSRPDTLPGRRVEAWKYSDLRAAVRKPLELTLVADVSLGPDVFGDIAARPITYVNGRLRCGETGAGPAGVHRLRVVTDASGTTHGLAAEFLVHSGEHVLLLETHEGRGHGYASQAQLALTVEAGATLERIVLLDEPESAVSVVRATVRLGERATFRQTTLASGSKLQRFETDVAHPGGGAEVRLDGVYVLDGARHADLTSVVTHEGVDGVTSELTKGVVRDRARGVFQGKIVVAEGADRTDARMGHHALLLSDRAEVDAKPELEIFADEVSCAHGNTVGALDEEALFYAQSRGVPEPEARAMLIEAFLGEVVDRIEHEGAREACRAWVAGKLRGGKP